MCLTALNSSLLCRASWKKKEFMHVEGVSHANFINYLAPDYDLC